VRGSELEIGGDDPQERMVKAFQILVDKVYTNLPMLRGVTYTEADLAKAGRVDGGLFSGEGDGLTEAEQEVFNHAQAQMRLGVKVSVKALTEKFGAKPYGWPTVAVLCLTATAREMRAAFEALDLGDVVKVEIANNQFGLKYRMLRQE